MEVRWKVLLGAVVIGVVVSATMLLRQPVKPLAGTGASHGETSHGETVQPAGSAGESADAAGLAASATLAVAEQKLPGTWVDQTPPGAAKSTAPLVIGLHGRGDTPEHFSNVAAQLGPELAWRFLKAPLPWRENTQWFDRQTPDGGRAALDSAERLVEAHVRSATGRKVALVGFSQGCMLAAQFVVDHPNQVAAVLCIGGDLVLPPSTPLQVTGAKPAILFVHGTEDALVPIARVRDTVAQFTQLGLPAEMLEHPEGHTIPAGLTPRLHDWLKQKIL